jgi:chromate reductase
MKNIIAFGASSSRQSINKKLAKYTADQIKNTSLDLLDLNDYEMPIYSIDKENETGIPQLALDFKGKIRQADGIIISFAEHNGAYSAAFKNIYDWVSRIEADVWLKKPMFIMATSPGGRGGQGVLEMAYARFSRANENLIESFSLPFFDKNFDENEGITDEEINSEYRKTLITFERKLGI